MNCLLIQEYEVITRGLNYMVKDFKNYMEYSREAMMMGPWGYHPNRCVYIVPETNKWYLWLQTMGVGRVHLFDQGVLESRGWI